MIETTVICDLCGGREIINNPRYMLTEPGSNPSLHFCSQECLYRYVSEETDSGIVSHEHIDRYKVDSIWRKGNRHYKAKGGKWTEYGVRVPIDVVPDAALDIPLDAHWTPPGDVYAVVIINDRGYKEVARFE